MLNFPAKIFTIKPFFPAFIVFYFPRKNAAFKVDFLSWLMMLIVMHEKISKIFINLKALNPQEIAKRNTFTFFNSNQIFSFEFFILVKKVLRKIRDKNVKHLLEILK
jgi:hypothetical protein